MITLVADTIRNIRLDGGYFTSDITVTTLAGIVSNTNILDDDFLEFSLDTVSVPGVYDVTITNEYGTTTLPGAITIIDSVGTGVAGTTTNDFGQGLGNWISGGSKGWTISTSGTTPSGGTGPTSNPAGSTGFAYVETSGTVISTDDATLTFTDFAKAQSISFDYHMFGSTMGDLILQYSPDLGNTWIDILVLSGAQQATQADPFINSGPIDLSALGITALRFNYINFSAFQADVAITNVIITSI